MTASIQRKIAGGAIVASVIGLSAAIAWSTTHRPKPPAIPPPPPLAATAAELGPFIPEEPELADDYQLVDPGAQPSAGLEGVVPSLSDLPVPLTKRTMRYVEQFAVEEKGKKTFKDTMRRGARYRDHIERELLDADLPEDLLYVAAIESGFNPQATSPKGAAGIFQFMPLTAERFGLLVSDDIDERRSITKATSAAIAYLKVLYATYGSWDLAIAAYNCGEERLDSALDKAHAMLKRDFALPVAFHELAELRLLPSETANFVPQIHAFAIVAHNRELLDLEDLDPPPSMAFAEIAVPGETRLAPIAKAAGISIATLQEYNPDLLADHLPAGQGDFLVNVPEETMEQTMAALPALRARDADRPEPAKPSSKPRRTASAGATEPRADAGAGSKSKSVAGARKGAATSAEPRAAKLEPAPNDKGLFMLSNGVLVELVKDERADVEVSATVEVRDPSKNGAKVGEPILVAKRSAKVADLDAALAATSAELARVELGPAARSLRTELASARSRFYAKTGFGSEFGALAERVFPDGHPMHGATLVGVTEPADDMFLDVEPTWARRTVVTLRGPVDADALAAPLEKAFGGVFIPAKLPELAPSARVTLAGTAPNLLVGWVSAPITEADETASHLAFLLACHGRLGRLHRELKPDRSTATRVLCSLERSPQAAVAWVLVEPAAPLSATSAEAAIDKAIVALSTDGPSESELASARQLLRVELARDRDTATIRGIPKSRVAADNDRILSGLDDVRPADIQAAVKAMFSKDHRVVVSGG